MKELKVSESPKFTWDITGPVESRFKIINSPLVVEVIGNSTGIVELAYNTGITPNYAIDDRLT